MDAAIKELDALQSERKFQEICNLFDTKYNTDEFKSAELKWRHARALRDLANNTTDKNENKRLLYKALETAKSGLSIDENCVGCNKWYGILLDLTGRIEGIKKRIENSFEVKKHLDIANEKANHSDVGVLHSLGVWCYEVSALSWINRKLAATFFASPPTSTFEEALEHLTAAEKISPGFYASNFLYIGKTYEKLKKKEEAKQFLQKCLDFEGSEVDTINAKEEAKELIKKL